METLVDMAKRLGIRPNPRMTDREKKEILHRITEEMRRKTPSKYHDRIREGAFWKFRDSYYAFCKKVDRKLPLSHQLSKNYTFYKQRPKGIKAPSQYGFLWHDATEKYPIRERFVADIELDSPYFPEMIKKLDAFILKYKGQFKITDLGHTDRSDSLNMYLPYDITPQIAKEFVQIIRPCLSEKYDDFLNGSPLTENGKIIKGVKTGPEYSAKCLQYKTENEKQVKKDTGNLVTLNGLRSDSSLGQKVATIEALNCLYYLVGKEGQNPYHLLAYDGKPYRKSLEIGNGGRVIARAPSVKTKAVPVAKKTSAPTKSVVPAKTPVSSKGQSFQSLLKALSQEIGGLRREVKACHRDMDNLHTYQVQTRRLLRKV